MKLVATDWLTGESRSRTITISIREVEHLHLCAAPPHNTGKKYSRPTKIITKIVPKQAIPISNAKWASEPLSEDFHSPPCCPFLCLSVFPLSATPRITPTAPPPPLLHPVEPLLAGLLPDWGSTKDVHTRKMVTRRRPATEGGKGSMILFFRTLLPGENSSADLLLVWIAHNFTTESNAQLRRSYRTILHTVSHLNGDRKLHNLVHIFRMH